MISLLLLAIALSQQPDPISKEPEFRLPSGKLQRDEILKEEFKHSLDDAADLVRLSNELKVELEKGGDHVLPLAVLRKTEEIEKLAKKIRARIKRY